VSRYFFNEGSFDSLQPTGGAMVDATIHVLRFAEGVRLFVDHKPVRRGATPRDLAVARNGHEARTLPRFTVLEERDGPATCDVAAYFREGEDLVYQLRRHFVKPPSAYTFTLRGQMADRAKLDAWMGSIFASLRFRPEPEGAAR
jgi:hypothetical protein